MRTRYLIPTVGGVAVLSAVTAVLVARRSRTDPPPVSPTVPRVEDLPPG